LGRTILASAGLSGYQSRRRTIMPASIVVSRPAPQPTRNAHKILIVDDDDELRESLSEQLSLHDEFETQLAATASEGLMLAGSGPVDLILLDVGLPDVDGRETCNCFAAAASGGRSSC
jgi:PleD family two-component response regulator